MYVKENHLKGGIESAESCINYDCFEVQFPKVNDDYETIITNAEGAENDLYTDLDTQTVPSKMVNCFTC